MMNEKHAVILLTALTLDPLMQGRAAMNQEQIEAYSEAMRDAARFPPIQVVHVPEPADLYYVVDGWHRVAAARAASLESIAATVTVGTYHDAFTAALCANAKHGLPRSNADKNRIAQLALTDPEISKLSDRKIADLLGLSQPFISKTRSMLKQTDNGYQSAPFDKLGLLMDEIGIIVYSQRKSSWVSSKDAKKLMREGLIAGDQSAGFRTTHRGIEYLEWLKNHGHEREKFELRCWEFSLRTNDPKYRWNSGWQDLEALHREKGWKMWYGWGSVNTLSNMGLVTVERRGDTLWAHINDAGCKVIDAPAIPIGPLPTPPVDNLTSAAARQLSPEEIEHNQRQRYETEINWTKDLAVNQVMGLTNSYWCKKFCELYPDMRIVFERAQKDLLAALADAQPIAFVPPVVDEPEAEAV